MNVTRYTFNDVNSSFITFSQSVNYWTEIAYSVLLRTISNDFMDIYETFKIINNDDYTSNQYCNGRAKLNIW